MRYKKVVAVEIDRGLIPVLDKTLSDFDNVTVINEDILKVDLADLVAKYAEGMPVSVCANLPYYITTPIIMMLLESNLDFESIVIMVQKEVAERLAASPGSKAYGILSVLVQLWYDVDYLFTVAPGVFNPPPKVQSAVIRMTRNDRQECGADERLLKRVVKGTFNQRRKMLRVSLRPLFAQLDSERGVTKSHADFLAQPLLTKRPEQLSVEEFIDLTNAIEAEMA
jgi:16S rRNA (adenine1518-N6/adenine1519-N6)-dimethyltransferase